MHGLVPQRGPSAGGRGGREEGLQEEGALAQRRPVQGAQRRCQVRGPSVAGGSLRFPTAETKAVLLCFCLPCGSVKPPHEGSRQRSCSAPNLRRSPRHSPAVPGVPSLLESGKRSFFLRDESVARSSKVRETHHTRLSETHRCVYQHGKKRLRKHQALSAHQIREVGIWNWPQIRPTFLIHVRAPARRENALL